MTGWDLLAGVGFFINDILAVLSVVGSFVLLLVAIISGDKNVVGIG